MLTPESRRIPSAIPYVPGAPNAIGTNGVMTRIAMIATCKVLMLLTPFVGVHLQMNDRL